MRASDKMGDQKEISDMSFEEFFSESKKKAERAEDRKAAAQKTYPDKPKETRNTLTLRPYEAVVYLKK